MRLYTPELGDKIRLIADWTFTLHRERRNTSLFSRVGWNPENHNQRVESDGEQGVHIRRYAYMRDSVWSPSTNKTTVGPPKPEMEFDLGEPVENVEVMYCWPEGSEPFPFMLSEDKRVVKVTGLVEKPTKFPDRYQGVDLTARLVLGAEAPLTLPAGSVLTVDRIYVRKGQGDFSSLSFFLAGGKKPKASRFWAKLSDCNNIEFEKVEP